MVFTLERLDHTAVSTIVAFSVQWFDETSIQPPERFCHSNNIHSLVSSFSDGI